MNKRTFSLSLGIAALAMMMVYSYLEGVTTQQIAQYGQSLPVIIAKENIQEMEEIDESKVTIVNIPKNFIANGNFSTIDEVRFKLARVPILKGEQITRPRVTNPGTLTGLARQVAMEKRAITISVDPSESVGGLIRPGDRVDIIAKIDYAGGRADKIIVRTILQDILVLSTGKKVTNALPVINQRGQDDTVQKINLTEYSDYSTVTLEVNPFQAQKIRHTIFLNGKPSLVLRNNDDRRENIIPASRIYDLLGTEDANDAKAYFNSRP